MNERGIVILDSILVLCILLVIGLSMMPAVSYLKKEVHYARQLIHASEVAYFGVSKVKHESIFSGTHEIESVNFLWRYYPNEICVEFVSVKGDENYCIRADQSVE